MENLLEALLGTNIYEMAVPLFGAAILWWVFSYGGFYGTQIVKMLSRGLVDVVSNVGPLGKFLQKVGMGEGITGKGSFLTAVIVSFSLAQYFGVNIVGNLNLFEFVNENPELFEMVSGLAILGGSNFIHGSPDRSE